MISPKRGRELTEDCLLGDFGRFGLNAACGWLRVVFIVPVLVFEEKDELESSKEVDGLFRGDRAPGGLFCSLRFSDAGDLWAVLLGFVGRLYRSRSVSTMRAGCALLAAVTPRSNRLAMSLTVPAGREGSKTGFERTLFSAGPGANVPCVVARPGAGAVDAGVMATPAAGPAVRPRLYGSSSGPGAAL